MTERKKPMSPNDSPSTSGDLAQREAAIDQTRSAIKEDLGTLGQRLSPEHLKEEAKELMSDAKNKAVETLHEARDTATGTFRDMKDSAMETVSEKVGEFGQGVRRVERETLGFLRQNAVPLALIGIGAYWLASSGRRREARWEGEYHPTDGYPSQGGEQTSSRMRDSARHGTARVRGGAREWAEEAQRRAGDAAGRVRSTAEHELEGVRHTVADVGERVSHAAVRARDYAGRELRDARDFSIRVTETHPLAVGAVALSAGLGLGLILPQTRRESELLGPQRDQLLERARETASDLSHTAKDVARDVKDSLGGAAHH